MRTVKDVFGTEKPIIALLHVRSLPGDPGYYGQYTLEEVVHLARNDLNALQDGGVDAILFSNEFSFPYQNHIEMVTGSALSYVIGRLKDDIRVPFGVHAIWDGVSTIDIAAAVGASFVRGVFTGGFVGERGIGSYCAGDAVRRKMQLRLDDLAMYYMLNCESDGDLSRRDPVDEAKAMVFSCAPDGICISGFHAGIPASIEELRSVRAVSEGAPVFSNTGTKAENVAERLAACDGAFVGTAFKKDGKFENLVDPERVSRFMEIVRMNR